MEQVDRHKKDYDAIVVNHHSDGGIEALRVMVDVPVVGMGEAIVWMAAYLVERFSMVTMYEGNRRLDRKVFHKMGLSSRLASPPDAGSGDPGNGRRRLRGQETCPRPPR